MSAALAVVHLLLAALCGLWLVGAWLGWRTLRTVPVLCRRAPAGTGPPPPAPPPGPAPAAGSASVRPVLAILVPASNEAGDAEASADLRAAHARRLAAALRLAEPAAEAGSGPATASSVGLTTRIVYVDDRSTDATGAVLDEFAAGAPEAAPVAVHAIHVRELPAGWLGKTWALQCALESLPAAAPPVAWVLLTDADVRLSPDALRLALDHAAERGLDHLVLAPQLHAGGLLRDATLGAFGRLFALNLAAVNDPKSRASVGVGAFNLIRREALARIGDLERVRLEVGDDMALGALLRRSGARQGVASGRELVQLDWYRTTGQIVRGLEKGIFAFGGRCRASRLYLGALALLVMELAPWAALLLGGAGWLRAGAQAPHWATTAVGLLGATAATLGIGIVALGERWMGRRLLPALLVPVGGLIMVWAVARAGWVGWRRGGVVWRGTLYPSALLRQSLALQGGPPGGRGRDR